MLNLFNHSAISLVSAIGISCMPALAQATSPDPVQQKEVESSTSSVQQYQNGRARTVASIEGLRAKGVGVSPFISELTRIDGLYTSGARDAVAQLAKLDEQISSQQRCYEAMRKRGTTAPHSLSNLQSVPRRSVAAYHGTMDGFVSEVIGDILHREVGQFTPTAGPFLVERFRIAKRIHELETERGSIAGISSLYKNMEDVVATHDPRRLAELAADVTYLQTQLGLSELQGSAGPLNLSMRLK